VDLLLSQHPGAGWSTADLPRRARGFAASDMPEFRVTELAGVGEEFAPRRRTSVVRGNVPEGVAGRPESVSEGGKDAAEAPAGEVPGAAGKPRRTALKRGYLPQSRRAEPPAGNGGSIGEVQERDSVFRDALSRKLPPDPAPAGPPPPGPRRRSDAASAAPVAKTTRMLDENYQELAEPIPLPLSAIRRSSSRRSSQSRGGRSTPAGASSPDRGTGRARSPRERRPERSGSPAASSAPHGRPAGAERRSGRRTGARTSGEFFPREREADPERGRWQKWWQKVRDCLGELAGKQPPRRRRSGEERPVPPGGNAPVERGEDGEKKCGGARGPRRSGTGRRKDARP